MSADILALDGHVFDIVKPFGDSYTHTCDGVTYYLVGSPMEGWISTSTAHTVNPHPTNYRTAGEAFAAALRLAHP